MPTTNPTTDERSRAAATGSLTLAQLDDIQIWGSPPPCSSPPVTATSATTDAERPHPAIS